jgi:hypothetical protein
VRKEYKRTELDAVANQLSPNQSVRWGQFLLWRDGFNINMPIRVTTTSVGKEVEQRDLDVLRFKQRQGVGFAWFLLNHGELTSERSIGEQLEVF